MRSQHCGYWCPGAKAPRHQYPQCWLNVLCIGPVSYKTIAHKVNSIRKWNHIFMPPPLGAGGIMFSGCPSIGPSVRPKPEIPSFDLHMGPLVHPTNHNRFTACPSVCPSVRLSVRPSGEVSGHLPENAWREWPEILHADVSWPSSELISLWPRFVDFSNFGAILT